MNWEPEALGGLFSAANEHRSIAIKCALNLLAFNKYIAICLARGKVDVLEKRFY